MCDKHRQEEQEGILCSAKRYFINMIKEDPELEFVGCYGDYGKSGRFAEKRPEFQKMIRM
jgi:DNA invertase Pin-like site-specific DNA recombinase